MTLRIVTWNCASALHTKYERLLALRPDVAIVPECAEPDILRREAPDFSFSDCEWQGTLSRKGLGVFAFNGLSLRRHQSWTPRFHIFLPVEIRGSVALNLLAVWAFNRRAPKDESVGDTPPKVRPNPRTTADAVAHYADFLCRPKLPSLVAGDFNANAQWDRVGRYAKFADLNTSLEELKLFSAYHASTEPREEFGQESVKTLAFRRDVNKGYHIDYVYLPENWRRGVRSVDVGTLDEWVRHSDHAPITVEVDVPV